MAQAWVKRRNNRLLVGNNLLELGIELSTGHLASIKNLRTGASYRVGKCSPLFYLWVLKSDTRYDTSRYGNDSEPYRAYYPGSETLRSCTVAKHAGGVVLTVNHRLLDGIDVTYKLHIRQASELVEMTIKVDNRRGARCAWQRNVVLVAFPQIGGLRLGRTHKDDVLVRPHVSGEKIPNPAENMCRELMSHEGKASMMWMDLYDGQGGLYLGSHDSTLLMTELETEREWGDRSVRLGIRKYAYIPVGEVWKSEPYFVGIHEGDWHWGADRYREWASRAMRRPRVPGWIRRCDGWYGVGFGRKGVPYIGYGKCFHFRDMVKKFKEALNVGLDYMSFWGYQVIGGCYRWYYPDPILGGPEAMRKAVSAVRASGGHVSFYTNSQAFHAGLPKLPAQYNGLIPDNVERPSWDRFRWSAVCHFDGSFVRQYTDNEDDCKTPSLGHRLMCQSARPWQDYQICWIAEKNVGEMGADAAYFDQVGGPPAKYCFNFNHGHEHHGAWTQGHVQMLRRIITAARRYQKDFGITIEGCGDASGQYCSMHLLSTLAGWQRYPAPEVFQYTFPHYILIDGYANGIAGLARYGHIPGGDKRKHALRRTFLMGYRFDLCTPLPRGDKFTDFAKQVVSLRKAVKKVLYEAEFDDDLAIVRVTRGVLAKCFRDRRHQRAVITLLDNRKKPAQIAITFDPVRLGVTSNAKVALHTLDGTSTFAATQSDAGVSLRLPRAPERIAAIVLHG